MKLTLKKKVILIIVVVLIITAIGLFILAKSMFGAKLVVNLNTITSSEEYDVNIVKQEKEVTYLAKESGENFKILAFTDLHFDGMDKETMDKTMAEFLNAMNKERPDLVIFTGDIVTTIFNKERAEKLADIMEAYGIYWCTVLGNHEGEHPLAFSRENLIKLWSNNTKYQHCLVEMGPKDIFGYGNYVVNLLNSDQVLSQSLIFMDSGAYVSKDDVKNLKVSKGSYDYIKADQIDWYKEKINSLPKGTKSSLFIHIPLCEYATGWDAVYDAANGTFKESDDWKYISGMQREPVCCSEYNSGLFDVMVSLGSTQAVFCGHDHVNDYSISKKGIDLNYLQPSGYGVYGWNEEKGTKTMILKEQSMQGYSVLDMKATGEYQITRIMYKNN